MILFYDTAHVNSKGGVFFAGDHYGHDAKFEAALRKGYPYKHKGA